MISITITSIKLKNQKPKILATTSEKMPQHHLLESELKHSQIKCLAEKVEMASNYLTSQREIIGASQ